MTDQRYVVTRPLEDSGVGSNLSSLGGAAWIAHALGRTLLVDWRGMDVLRDKSLNYFAELFEPVRSIAGVSVVYAGVDAPEYGDECAWTGVRAASRETSSSRFLGLRTYHGIDRVVPAIDALDRHRFLKSVYADVKPRQPLRGEIERWWQEHADGRFTVAVNLRTGNGHWFYKGGPYRDRLDASIFRNRDKLLRKLRAACDARARNLPRALRTRYVVFYATDSLASHELLGRLPNAITRRTVFPPPGSGDHFSSFDELGYTDREAVADSVADMFLLSRCHALVYNFSLFNQYPRVVTDYYGGNLANIETLYWRRWTRLARREVRRRLSRRR